MRTSVATVDINSITFDTKNQGAVAKSAHVVKKGFGKDGDIYFCKLSQAEQAADDTIASILAEKWYRNFALVSETRLISEKDSKAGAVSMVGSASVGLKGFTETKKILDTLTQGREKLTLHEAGNTDSPFADLPKFRRELDKFLKHYKPMLERLSGGMAYDQCEDFDRQFDRLFTDAIAMTVEGKELTLKNLAHALVSGKAGMDIALMLYPDGDNHQCNNGISIDENDAFRYSKIDHDYSVSRLKALAQGRPMPKELKCQMDLPIVAALIEGNPVPLQVTRRFDPAKRASPALRKAHTIRSRVMDGAKTTTSRKDALLTRAIQLRYRELYQQEAQKALLKATSVTALSEQETNDYQDAICKLLSSHVANPDGEAQAILDCYAKFLLQNQQNLQSILAQMDLTQYPDFQKDFIAIKDNDIGLSPQVSILSYSSDTSGYESLSDQEDIPVAHETKEAEPGEQQEATDCHAKTACAFRMQHEQSQLTDSELSIKP